MVRLLWPCFPELTLAELNQALQVATTAAERQATRVVLRGSLRR
jgi:hypothetical protein